MKSLLVVAALVGIAGVTGAAENPKKEKPPVTLKVGDPAPALKVSKWLQGKAIKEFERGKVYVVEFWATWCGPCIAFMPDLAALQVQYKDKGVTCIGFTAGDPDNTEEKAAAFVKKRGPKLPYTFAYADDRTTFDAWMTAAGRESIPCTFVVDKAGQIAYIGNPMYLDEVVRKVLAKDATAKQVSAEMDKVIKEWLTVSEALDGPDNKAGLRALKDFEDKYPSMANNPIIVRVKLSKLPMMGRMDEAKKVAEAVMAKAIKQENPNSLVQVSALLRLGSGKESKELLAVAVKAAEAAVQLSGDKDARVLLNLASTYFVAGDKVKAREYAGKAIEAAAGESTEVKQAIEKEAASLTEERKEDKK